MRRGPKPAKSKEAKPPVVRKSPNDEGARVRDLEKELAEAFKREAEAREQQSATAEILRVISQSPTDIQSVFETLLQRAVRLCAAGYAALFRFDGSQIHLAAAHNLAPDELSREYPMSPTRGKLSGRAILSREAAQIADILADPDYRPTQQVLSFGVRSILAVPMVRSGDPVGAILIYRREVGLFPDKQVMLLQTFADQAVIAIENVRLFTELQEKNEALTQAHAHVNEALERQTATSEILRVISSSPTDMQPVFDAIAESAARLCDAVTATVFRFDGARIHLVAAHRNVDPGRLESLHRVYPMPPTRGAVAGRVIIARSVVHVADVSVDPEYTLPLATTVGFRSVLGVPMLREGEAVGAILVARDRVAPFSEAHTTLLQTFADQAVIAIENVRLFTELQEKNRALTQAHAQVTETLEQQTATGEILRVISQSQTDSQPVFDTTVTSAVRLLRARSGSLTRISGEHIVLAALTTTDDAGDAALRALFPLSLRADSLHSFAIRSGKPINVADAYHDPRASESGRVTARARAYQSVVVVPLLRHDEALGSIAVTRSEPGGFADDEIELLKTFADQAVIAIENVRLFKELEAANRGLAAASQHKSEFLANMSHELRTPLNAIIGFSEVLSEKMFGELNEKQEEYSKDIHASGQHLLSLINDILDLSKIEAGRMELELSDFHLPTALDSALTLVRERAGRRSIALHINVDERLGQMRADERKVRQIVLNLLSNAIKFTPEGGRIEVVAVAKDGLIEVSVSDTGVGIAPEDQEAVFDEFRQVGTADKKIEGTGLGLTLCRKFVELHGGKIWVKSEVGVGSTFTFSLPLGNA
jgi:signal transduction histidine kinase